MRFRFKLRRGRGVGTRRVFAWWPRRMPNGTWVWLEHVTRYSSMYPGYLYAQAKEERRK